MINNKKILVSLGLMMGLTMQLFADDKSSKEIRGDKYFFVYSFEKAIDAYSDSKELTVEGQRRLAESYQNLNMNAEAEIEYLQLLNTSGGTTADDYFNYVMVLRANDKTDEAKNWMHKFQDKYPNDLRAIDYEKNKFKLEELAADNGRFGVLHLDVNTEAQDFCPAYYKNDIVFSSSRSTKAFPRDYNYNGLPFLDIYVSEKDGKQLKDPSVFDKNINGKMHDGPASFNAAGDRIAFTKNNYDTERKDRIVELQIFFSQLKDGKWSEAEAFVLNNTDYSVGHPSLSADGNTMYFTSDMPGGFGGADIYRVEKSGNGTWGKAMNLGNKVNTEGNELFPFYESNNEILFFASNGRCGLGGLDIFMVAIDGEETGIAKNAGAPLNTKYDDFGVVVDSKLMNGYFSSNRTGGSGSDDIYAFDILKDLGLGKKVRGIAKDVNGQVIPFTFITLHDDSAKVLDTLTTGSNGAYTFFVESDENFTLEGKNDKYEDGETAFNSYGTTYVIIADVTLLNKAAVVTTVEKEVDLMIVGADLGLIAQLKPFYFDFDKSVIRDDAEIELDKIVKVMNANPTMEIKLSSYADCRATKEYNQILSDKRAVSSVNYIKTRISNPARISGKGYSESKLVNDCSCADGVVSGCTEAEHQENRRTEFIITKK